MRVDQEMLNGPMATTRASNWAETSPQTAPAAALLFGGRPHLHALISSSRVPALATWIETWSPAAIPLPDLSDDPRGDEVMPFLLQLSPGDKLLQFMLTLAEPPSLKALWSSGAVIFVRQHLSTPEFHRRISHNLKIEDGQGRRHFLRFWDADVVVDLLTAIALAGHGFRGPFPVGTERFLPQADGRLHRITLHRDTDERDDLPLRITPELHQLLAEIVERKAVCRIIGDVIAADPACAGNLATCQALLDQAAQLLLVDGWPVRAMAPILRVVAERRVLSGAMPSAATEILQDNGKPHAARARILEYQAPAIFDARYGQGQSDSDLWLAP